MAHSQESGLFVPSTSSTYLPEFDERSATRRRRSPSEPSAKVGVGVNCRTSSLQNLTVPSAATSPRKSSQVSLQRRIGLLKPIAAKSVTYAGPLGGEAKIHECRPTDFQIVRGRTGAQADTHARAVGSRASLAARLECEKEEGPSVGEQSSPVHVRSDIWNPPFSQRTTPTFSVAVRRKLEGLLKWTTLLITPEHNRAADSSVGLPESAGTDHATVGPNRSLNPNGRDIITC